MIDTTVVKRERIASAPAWIAVGLSILATLFAAVNWQRSEDLSDIEQQLIEQDKYSDQRDKVRQEEIGHLRDDLRELRQIVIEMKGQ